MDLRNSRQWRNALTRGPCHVGTSKRSIEKFWKHGTIQISIRLGLVYVRSSNMKLAENILIVMSMTLALWVLVHSLHQSHLSGNHIFTSLEVEEKSENLSEDKEDVDQLKAGNTLFLSQPYRAYTTYTYISPYISSYDVPPEHAPC